MAVQKYRLGTPSTLTFTGLDGLGIGALAVSAEYDNAPGAAGDGATLADLELAWGYAATVSAGVVSAWFLGSQDGTTFEDGGPGVTPGRAPDVVFAPNYAAADQRQGQRITLPAGKFKVLLKNDGASQVFKAGNALRIRPVALEVV